MGVVDLSSVLREVALVAKKHELSEPYLVGGAIRDMVLGKEPKDYDITCGNEDSLVLAKILAEHWGVPVYEMGSGSLKVFNGGLEFDFSPNVVLSDIESGSAIENETRSRDFTINAILVRLSDGKVFDFCNGIDDIFARRLRLCSKNSFSDPRRLLRALRFIAEGYTCDEDLLKSLVDNFDSIKKIKQRHAKSMLNAALRTNPDILVFLKECGLLSKLPLSKMMLDWSRKKRLIGEL